MTNSNNRKFWIFLPRDTREDQNQIKIYSFKCLLTIQISSYIPKKPTGRPKTTKKDEKKLVADVLKNPMASLEKVRVHFNSFSTKESISRQTVRKILRKHGIRGQIAAQKLKLKREHKINRQKWCKLMKNRPFSYWQDVVFTDETRVRQIRDAIVRKKETRYNVENLEKGKDKRSLIGKQYVLIAAR